MSRQSLKDSTDCLKKTMELNGQEAGTMSALALVIHPAPISDDYAAAVMIAAMFCLVMCLAVLLSMTSKRM